MVGGLGGSSEERESWEAAWRRVAVVLKNGRRGMPSQAWAGLGGCGARRQLGCQS